MFLSRVGRGDGLCRMLMRAPKNMLLSEPENPRRQVGALVWRMENGVLEVLLVTSRDTGRFVIPKGWPMKGLSDAKAAAQEAYEEAGVEGKPGKTPIGHYSYSKIFGPGFALPCVVDVYAMQLDKILKRWPEKQERKRRWMLLHDAALSVHEPELRDLIDRFIPVL